MPCFVALPRWAMAGAARSQIAPNDFGTRAASHVDDGTVYSSALFGRMPCVTRWDSESGEFNAVKGRARSTETGWRSKPRDS